MIGSIGRGGNDQRLVNQTMNNIVTKVPMNRISAMKNDVTMSKWLVRSLSRSALLSLRARDRSAVLHRRIRVQGC